MASLTPGVLSKLLENVGNTDIKVAGEHRSALLQVIGIVPSLVGADDGDPWRSKGYFLRVSDSMHSAYVSISDEDVDLILTDKIQLGQFIHVARLDLASPVPVLRGVKPVPRRRPCVGHPKDLISSDSLSIPTKVDFSAKKGSKILKKEGMKKPEEKAKRSVSEDSKPRRLSMENGKVEGLELRRLSFDSTRKGWDRGMGTTNSSRPPSRSKSKETSSFSNTSFEVHSGRKSASGKDSAMKSANLNISPLKNKNENVSQKLIGKTSRKNSKTFSDGTFPSNLVKLPLSFNTWSARKVSWDLLPHNIHDLGKEAMDRRDLAFLAAVHALEEASASDYAIRCMSMFAELCQCCQKYSAGNLVEQFLNLHEDMRKAVAVVDALLGTRLQEPKTSPTSHRSLTCENLPNKNAVSWVLAGVETNLSKFSLFKKEEKGEISTGEKCHIVVLENTSKKVDSENHSPECKRSPSSHGSSMLESHAKGSSPRQRYHLSATRKTRTGREDLSKGGSGLKGTAALAEKLLSISRSWFLNYLEDSLNKGFGLRKGEASSEVASLLRQIKRVNKWLDDLVVDGIGTDERIEGLRKQLYGFLLEHVDSTVVAGR